MSSKQNKIKTKYAVVLGYGILNDGSLPILSQNRVKKSVELYKANAVEKIIFSGNSSFYLNNYGFSESLAMKSLAQSLDVPEDSIIVENFSDDLITNAFYTFNFIANEKLPNELIVITSTLQMRRAKIAFNKAKELKRLENINISFISVEDRPYISIATYFKLAFLEFIKWPLMSNSVIYNFIKRNFRLKGSHLNK